MKDFATGDFFKISFDVVVRPTFSVAAAVLSHSNGVVSKAWTEKVLSTDPLIGEASATLLAPTKASDLFIRNFVFFGALPHLSFLRWNC